MSKLLTNKVVNAIVILTRKVVNLLVGRWGTENSGTFDAARGPFGPTHAGRKEEKGRRQNAGGPVIQNISGYFRGNETLPLLNHLKEYRSRLGINQTELGKLAGVSRQTISLIERGDYSPSVTLALKLAKLCQVTVEDIFVYEEDEEE